MSDRLALFDQMIAKGSNDPFVFYARAMEIRKTDRNAALTAFSELADNYASYVPTFLMAAQVCDEEAKARDTDAPEDADRLWSEARQWCERGKIAAKAAGDGHAEGELQAFLDELP